MMEQTEFVVSLLSLLKSGISFAAYSLPGHTEVEYIVDDNTSPLSTSRKFIISTWNGDKYAILDRKCNGSISDSCVDANSDTRRYGNRNEANSSNITNSININGINGVGDVHKRENTPWEVYKSAIETVTNLLRSTDGKVVVSRQKVVEDSRLDYAVIAKAIEAAFAASPKAFRAVYFTPATGAWCVCSPELLLHINRKTGRLHTVALAGTRKADVDGNWDSKNVNEHSYVVRHIANVLKNNGIGPEISASETMAAGKIRHILTRISGNIPDCKDESLTDRLLQALHPTPAICGYPIDWSRGVIKQVEQHDRECYGGYIAVEDEESFYSHVNLRCFAFGEGKCCFWGGGGIMKDSTPESEWNETELKIDATLAYLRHALSHK